MSTIEIFTNWVPLEIDDCLLWVSIIILLTLWFYGLKKGAEFDNSRFLKKFNKGEYIPFTHKASREVLAQKLGAGVLIPYPDKSSGILGTTELGRLFVKNLDHPMKATWGHYGRPSDSNDYKQGLISFVQILSFWKKKKPYYESAITVYVPIDIIKFPEGTVKKIFGRHQILLEQEIQLGGSWVELHENIEVDSKLAWVSLGINKLDDLKNEVGQDAVVKNTI